MFFYILSISFQLAGSTILLIFPNRVNRAYLVKSFLLNSFTSANENSLEYDHKAYVKSCETIHSNCIAFFYLLCGYFLSIFATNQSEKRLQVLISIAVIFVVLIIISRLVVSLIIKHSKKVTQRITIDELGKLGINPNLESIKVEEIDKLCNN